MQEQRPLALVTGGCRRLGAAIAARLAGAGWDLALHAHRAADPEASLAAAIAAAGVRSAVIVADFDDLADVETVLPAVVAMWQRPPDLIVNSASMFGDDRLVDTNAAALEAHYRVNCAAPAILTRDFAAFPADSVEDGRRCIVNILDQRLVQPHADQFAYTLSKFALAGLTETSARALAPAIRVNAVAPGLTLPTADYSDARLNDISESMPLRRLPSPQDVADAVLYLAEARSVTGQTIFVDGGARFQPWQGDFLGG